MRWLRGLRDDDVRRRGWLGLLRLLLRWGLLGLRVVRWHGVVGALAGHAVGSWGGDEAWLWNGLLVGSVAHVRRVELGATVAGAGAAVEARWGRRRRGLHGEAAARDERLRFGVEGLAVVAARDGVLALWIVRVDVHRQLAVRVRDAGRRHRARPRGVGGLAVVLRLRPRRLGNAGRGTAERAAHRRIGSPVSLLRRGRGRHSLWWHSLWDGWCWVL